MIKLKKASVLALSALLLSSSFSSTTVFADELDDKISSQNQKIEQLEKNQNDANAQLTQLENEVKVIENDVNNTLKEKANEEKHLNELTQKIEALKIVIEKREDQLQEQARNLQAEQGATSVINTVMESKSLNEAMEKTIAATKLMNASKDIMDQQNKDKQELETLQAEAKKRLTVIQQKTTELKAKQEQLGKAKLDQQVEINEISANLTNEKDQKAKFIKQKEEAERKRQAALKALEEQRAREAKAHAEAVTAAKKAAEQQQAAAQKAAKEAQAKAATAQQAAQQAKASEQAAAQKAAEEAQAAAATAQQQAEIPVAEQKPATPEAPKAASSGWASPLATALTVTSPFGYRSAPIGGVAEHHDGVDFAGTDGTPVMAAKEGTVVEAGFHYSAGNHVVIQHGDGHYSYYMHFNSTPAVSVGQTVSAGQVIGGMGTSGNSTGTHLHFGVSTALWSSFINPAPLLGL